MMKTFESISILVVQKVMIEIVIHCNDCGQHLATKINFTSYHQNQSQVDTRNTGEVEPKT